MQRVGFFSREALLDSVRQLSETPGTPNLLYVTHHIEEILPMYTHTILIRRGTVFAKGKTTDILSSETLSTFLKHLCK